MELVVWVYLVKEELADKLLAVKRRSDCRSDVIQKGDGENDFDVCDKKKDENETCYK